MAHDRAERFPKLIIQTPAKVGPGTYEIEDVPELPGHLADVYPFLRGSKRDTLSVSKDARNYPPPNCYNVKEPQRHIPERVSIDFTDIRFKRQVYEGPGPAEYDVSEDVLNKCPKIRTHPGTWKGPAGKLWLTQPPRSVLPPAISMPTKNDGGFRVNKYGALVKNPPIKHEPTAFYDIPRQEANYATLMYKGNFWSRMTGRSELKSFSTPGPGDYEHESKRTAAQIRDEKIREAKRGSSRQLRFLDALYRKKMLENFPAPNRYKVKGSFDRFFKIPYKCDSYIVEPPPFGVTAKRFGDKVKSDTPAPGTYETQGRTKCVTSIYPAPFGACTGRFQKITQDIGPAPCDYHSNVGNLAYESQKRFKYSYTRPAGSTYFDEITMLDEADEDYDAAKSEERDEEKKSKVYHAAFKSRIERFCKPDRDNPDPGAYEVSTAFKANHERCEFLCRELAPPFGTRGSRLPKTPRALKVPRPDPTSYKVATDIARDVKGGVMSSSCRPAERPRAPSPMHYCMHPYVSSSVLKKSFNVVLGKPKVIRDLSKLEARGPRSRCPHAKKKLRWFIAPLKEYQHCYSPCIPIL